MIEVKTFEKENRFYIEIKDSGNYFNLLEFDEADTESILEERKIGGLGIHFIKNFAESIEYKRENNKNIIIFSVPST
jgi:serine/threonine-protein kinase RsbW